MKPRQTKGRRTPILTQELGSVLEVEDPGITDPKVRAAVAAARKGPPITRGRVWVDSRTGKYNLTLEIDGPIQEFEDSNTLRTSDTARAEPKATRRPRKSKRTSKAKKS